MPPGGRGAQQGEGRPRQHVAAVRSLVAEDAVVEQGVGPAVMNTKQRRPTSAIPGPVRLAEPDVRGQHRKADVAADAAFRVEHRRPQPVEAEAATALPTDAARKSVVTGKSGAVRVDTGGRRIIKKTKKITNNNPTR